MANTGNTVQSPMGNALTNAMGGNAFGTPQYNVYGNTMHSFGGSSQNNPDLSILSLNGKQTPQQLPPQSTGVSSLHISGGDPGTASQNIQGNTMNSYGGSSISGYGNNPRNVYGGYTPQNNHVNVPYGSGANSQSQLNVPGAYTSAGMPGAAQKATSSHTPVSGISPVGSSGPSQSQVQGAGANNPVFNLQQGENANAYNARVKSYLANGGGQNTPSTNASSGMDVAAINAQKEANYNNHLDVNSGQSLGSPQDQQNQQNSQQYNTSQPSYNGLVNQTSGAAKSAFDIGQQNSQSAYGGANNYLSLLENSRSNEANSLAENASLGIPLSFQQGRQQVLQNQYLSQQDALGQAANAESALYGTGVTAQGQGLSGLSNSAQLASPANMNVQVPYSNQYINGQTGQAVDPEANSSEQSAVALEAQKVRNNQETLGQAETNLGSYSQKGLNDLNQALGSGFNANTNAGASSGQQQVAGTTGAITSQQETQKASYQSALKQGQNLQSQLTDLITKFGLNPSNLNVANQAIQKIAQNTSSPQYQQLQNYINDVANTYSQILTPAGGSPTDTTRGIATSMLNSTASGASLLSTMQALDNAAEAKISGVVTTGGSNSGGGSASVSGFGWHG